MNPDLHYDYTAVGHVSVDVLADGSRRAGGTAFYSALQAARLGCRTLILTQGVAAEIEALLAPYRSEVDLHVCAANATTTLLTRGAGPTREQRMLAWAGPMADEIEVDTGILHLAPIARECPQRWRGPCSFTGLTAQGLARDWSGAGGQVKPLAPPDATGVEIARRCHAIVVNEHERSSCQALIAQAMHAGAVIAITAGAAPTTILQAEQPAQKLPVPTVEHMRDDLGAGDVFAAAFFVALAQGTTAVRAAAFANAAAAVRMQGSGAGAIGDRDAIAARLDAVGRLGAVRASAEAGHRGPARET